MSPDPDDILERAAKIGGNALADAHGWHPDRGDYMMARTVIIAARPVIEAPLRAEITKLRQELEFFHPYEDLILDIRAGEHEAAMAPTWCPDCGHPWERHTTGGMCAGWPDTPAGTDPCYCVRLRSSTSA